MDDRIQNPVHRQVHEASQETAIGCSGQGQIQPLRLRQVGAHCQYPAGVAIGLLWCEHEDVSKQEEGRQDVGNEGEGHQPPLECAKLPYCIHDGGNLIVLLGFYGPQSA